MRAFRFSLQGVRVLRHFQAVLEFHTSSFKSTVLSNLRRRTHGLDPNLKLIYFERKRMSSSDNDSDVDANVPSGAECFERCKKFVELTNTDTALAMFYLQDVQWDLQKAVEIYYNATNPTGSKVVACFDVEQLNKDEELARAMMREECNDESINEDVEAVKKRFKWLSWNIDGLDPSNLETRTRGVITVIAKEEPDLVFFQEVIPSSYRILKESLEEQYALFCAVDVNNMKFLDPRTYFTMILMNKDTCELDGESKIIPYTNTCMSRNLLKARLRYRQKISITAMTSHLESTADYTKQRTEQLRLCFSEMLAEKDESYVLFGGDLNLRDAELEAIGGLPEGVYDLWQSTGARKECLYTWDMTRNHNLIMNGKFKPRCRFDRLFYRRAKLDNESLRLSPVYFELEGLEKLKNCGRFSSDHWAVQCYFDVISQSS